MKKIAVLGVVLIAAASPAQQTARSVSEAAEGDPNERVCVRMTAIGSRLAASRRCMTRGEWAAERRNTRALIDEGQLRQVNPTEDANGRYVPGRGAPR